MTQPQSPLSTPLPWDLVATDYAAELAPFFASYARDAIRLAGGARGRVLDVACGPGTLSRLAAEEAEEVFAIDFSEAMVRELRASAPGITAHLGDGQALPFEDASFDRAFSMFGLMFFPERARGYAELRRVLRPGGVAAVSSWLPADRSRGMRALMAAMSALAPPGARGEGAPPPRLPLSDREDHEREMGAAGFSGVEVHEVNHALDFATTEAMLAYFERTSAPLVLAKAQMGEAWPGARAQVQSALLASLGEGPQRIEMPAWVGVGRVA